MNKSIPLYVYGTIIILEGIFFFCSLNYTFHTIKFTLGFGLLMGAIFAFLTALTRQRRQVQFAYHEMHALAMMAYGISVLMVCTSLEMVLHATAYLFFFSAFSEIIFCSWLFNLGQTVAYKILFVRITLGLLTGLGTVISMNYTDTNIPLSIAVFSVLFILVGLNVILYVPVMKRRELSEL
ncbi:MAG: hypothetical protein V4651_08840 [Bacteroidota bacterium]